ncbi:MAG: ABC transporter substrate-binding protein [Alphaproteobacteria bacterium]|nr:ABC transporter substrate-binding protein [Alphaproteobacteria bacterium]
MTGKTAARVIAAVGCAAAFSNFVLASPVLAETVKIGMITTLSGDGAALGVGVRDGFLLAVKEEGGKLGGIDVEVLIEDDARKPDKAKQIADKFMKRDGAKILTGLIWSNLALAVVPPAVRSGVFYISPNAGPSQLAGKLCHENHFNVSWQNDNLPEAMGEYMKNKGFKRPFVISPNYPAGKDMARGFKRYFGDGIIKEAYTKLGAKDYAAEIAAIRELKPDSVFFFLPGGMGIAFVKQYAQSGLDIPLFGPSFSFDQGILAAVGKAALGVLSTSQWSKDIDVPANRAFVAHFQKEYGRLPSLYASQGYDAARLIASALKAAGGVDDADKFRAALKKADFESTRGDFRFNTNNFPIQTIYVRQVVEEDGVLTNKLVEIARKDHKDAYAGECKMK